jgi:hypothetical protein
MGRVSLMKAQVVCRFIADLRHRELIADSPISIYNANASQEVQI